MRRGERIIALAPALLLGITTMATADGGSMSPLTLKEQQDLRGQIAQCWNAAPLMETARPQVVTVAFELDPSGVPISDTITQVDARTGPERDPDLTEAQNLAFAAARRAIIRCGANGYKLPLEKHAQWRNIEVTFNPERMQLR